MRNSRACIRSPACGVALVTACGAKLERPSHDRLRSMDFCYAAFPEVPTLICYNPITV